MYKDVQKQKEAHRIAQAKYKAKRVSPAKGDSGITGQGITCKTGAGITYQELLDAPVPVAYWKDAVGTEFRVDYKGRRAAWLRLEGWARGEGTQEQYNCGHLGQVYGMLHGDYHTAPVLARYLGISEDLAGRLLAQRKVNVKAG